MESDETGHPCISVNADADDGGVEQRRYDSPTSNIYRVLGLLGDVTVEQTGEPAAYFTVSAPPDYHEALDVSYIPNDPRDYASVAVTRVVFDCTKGDVEVAENPKINFYMPDPHDKRQDLELQGIYGETVIGENVSAFLSVAIIGHYGLVANDLRGASLQLGGDGEVAISKVEGAVNISGGSESSPARVDIDEAFGYMDISLGGGSVTIDGGHLSTLAVDLDGSSDLTFDGYADRVLPKIKGENSHMFVGGVGEIVGEPGSIEPPGPVTVGDVPPPPRS